MEISASRKILLWATAAAALAPLILSWAAARAQAASSPIGAEPPAVAAAASTSQASLALPDAPGFARTAPPGGSAAGAPAAANSIHSGRGRVPAVAPKFHKVIEAGQIAPDLSPADKVRLGVRQSLTPFAIGGWFVASGYEQLIDSSPNYGTDRGAYGERVGAAAIRDTSEDMISDAVIAPALHEDPRYYRLGRSHGGMARFVYAITRPLVSRTDSGAPTANFAILTGSLAGAGLTNAYYPARNRGAKQTFETFGASMGGEAFADFVREFFGGFEDILHSAAH